MQNLDAFKTAFSNTYQEVFQRFATAMKIANTRLLSDLFYGKAIERVRIDISQADVEEITQYNNMTAQTVSDTPETLTVNKNPGIMFQLSEKEMVQAGPLNPGEFIGAQLAQKLALYLDADVLAETRNAAFSFDTGDLTGTTSNGVPIVLNSTNVQDMVMNLPAKLRNKTNQVITAGSNLVFVLDSYHIANTFKYLLGKNADFVNSLFQNGYVNEQVAGAKVYVSENLTGEAVLGLATQPTANDTVTIQGVTFTFVASPTVAGDVDLGANVDATRANLAAAINGGAGAGTAYIEVSAANRRILSKTSRITATNDDTANTLTIVGIGSGRLSVSETLTASGDSWTANFVNCYFGKAGAIDVVVQKDVKVDMRPEPRQPTTNIMSRLLYGIKTFTDGAQKFLCVKIAS